MDLRIGIIGPGGIANDQHAPTIAALEGAQLWSVLGRNQGRTQQFATRHAAVADEPAHTNLKSFLADPGLDAVTIATPDRMHASQAIAAAEAGKHILLEKPMATDIESGRGILGACRANDVTLAMAYHLRWHAGHRLLRQRILEGALGTPRHIRLHWTFKAPDGSNWRNSPETGRWWSLAANGTHCLDLARWFMSPLCGEVVKLTCLTSSPAWDSPHDETAVLALQFESGATAEICTSVLYNSPSRIEFYGSDTWAESVGTLSRRGTGQIRIGNQSVEFEPENPFLGEFRNFLRAIRTNTSPEVDGEEGLRNVELLLRAANSAARQNPVIGTK